MPAVLLSSLSTSSHNTTNINDGRLHTLIDDIFECVALIEYGSDVSNLAKSFMDQCISSGVNFETRKLPEPQQIYMETEESKNWDWIPSRSIVKLSITIMIPDSQIPLRLNGVLFLVIDQDMD